MCRPWAVCGRRRWAVQRAMPILEGEALLYGFRYLLRSIKNHKRRLVILCDSLTVCCALVKGHSSRREMLRVCRSVGALALATGTSLHVRWMPSEMNPADGPSRGELLASLPKIPFSATEFQGRKNTP